LSFFYGSAKVRINLWDTVNSRLDNNNVLKGVAPGLSIHVTESLYRFSTFCTIATKLIVQSNVIPFCTRKSSCSTREPELCCCWHPALIIGIVSSLILIVVMKVASVLQTMLWASLPTTFGFAPDSSVWTLLMLTLTGIAVGLVIRFSPGHAGPDPAQEPLIGAPSRLQHCQD
jgi:hypothetical protein